MTPRASRALQAWILVTVSSTGLQGALAADLDDQKAAAQVLFESGRSLLEQGHVSEACPKFAESQRLAPGLGTMLWLADCLETSGALASGWVAFKEAAALAAQRHDPREQVARDRALALEPRLSRLNLVVGPAGAAPGLEVRRDGIVVGPAEWGLPIPLDPGVHSVTATAPGFRSWSSTVDIRVESQTLAVTIPVLQAESVDRAVPLPSAVTPHGGTTQRVAGLAIGAAGVVGVIIGSVAGIVAKSTYDGSSGHCNALNECDAIGKQDRSSAITDAAIATVSMSIGAAALLGGGLIYLLAPSSAGVSAAICPAPNGGTIRMHWAF